MRSYIFGASAVGRPFAAKVVLAGFLIGTVVERTPAPALG